MTKPKTAQEALAEARRHGRAAAAEAAAALRALLDAAALGSTGRLSEDVRGLQAIGAALDDVHRWLEGGETNTAIVRALAEALETEIRRWEARSADDEEARAVLRAFLGLRELLWELGVRAETPAPKPSPHRSPRTAAAEKTAPESEAPRRAAAGGGGGRVRRISVEG